MDVSPHALAGSEARSATDTARPIKSLQDIIEHAAHLLPAQGPITAFVHHNTLHAFEELPFGLAVKEGGRIFGCEPYLPESDYRALLESNRITSSDIREVLLEDLGDEADEFVGPLGTRYHLRLAMLQYPLRTAPRHELRWLVAETDSLRKFRPETPAIVRQRMINETRHWAMRDLRNGANSLGDRRSRKIAKGLMERFGDSRIETWSNDVWEAFCLQLTWRVCCDGVKDVPVVADAAGVGAAAASVRHVRHRDVLLKATGEDSDRLVHDVLIRLCAAFLDQGMSGWPLPMRERGLYAAFVELYRQPGGPPDRWLRGLAKELRRLRDSRTDAAESLAESLQILGVEHDEQERFLSETLLALRGWAGMVWQSETRPDRVAHPVPEGSLVDFLAVRLILERFALAHVARTTLRFQGPLGDLRGVASERVSREEPISLERRAFLVFQLAQVLAWTPQELYRLTGKEWDKLVAELEAFSSLERRRVFHEAYERRYRIQTLDAVAVHSDRSAPPKTTPSYQVICCIDEREESFRRHLEEIAPDCETLGAAGFFGAAIYYRGADGAHFAPLCPAIIRPSHYVTEDVVYTFEESHRRRAKARRVLGTASHRLHTGSRTFAGGAFLTTLLGPLASIPLVARVLFPRLTAQIRRMVGRFVQTPPVTRLQLERTAPDPGPENGHVGYTVGEMADVVEKLLRDMGMTSSKPDAQAKERSKPDAQAKEHGSRIPGSSLALQTSMRIAPLIVVMGHGSSSLNNPHEAAHDCGACGGARGGPNARAFAQMANDPRVRQLVARNGLELPAEVYFVGGYHNTCDDSVIYFDLDRLPVSHKELFETARRQIDEARERSAHERCRRFESAPLNFSTAAALRHVEGRAEDLAQTRPEYGHATNSLCFVGRRWKNRGLFLDRRAFLTSYDPLQDDADCTILARILSAVIPVCAGISLEYYFSFVDSRGYGCGTKLPHNVTSLLGVMDGAASDLRTGLPWQMVEIHEPVRLLFIIETTPQAMLRIMDRNETIGTLCRNQWVQLATQDPETSEIHVFRNGRFQLHQSESRELPVVKSSIDWYRGWRKHLGFASVGSLGGQSPGHVGRIANPSELERQIHADGLAIRPTFPSRSAS